MRRFACWTAIEVDGVRAGGAAIDTRQQVVRAIEGISDEDFRLESRRWRRGKSRAGAGAGRKT